MSERMIPIPFRDLMMWAVTEHEHDGSVFGVRRPYRAGAKTLPLFGERIETPFGPAAGPHTQLAQNIISAYYAGARFFELKTVQRMDGAELAACIRRPCILAEDECYNCEWSTELTVQQAFEEYVKAWCAVKILGRLWGLGDPDGFVFDMSVGYDLDGIRGEKVDRFLEGMRDASGTPVFRDCLRALEEMFPGEASFIRTISPRISRAVTLSTLHGCPPDEIERIASYLIREKHLHTFVKCNPTILGYETARSILDGLGWTGIRFDDHHFREDLQYEDAVPMFRRLQALADREGVEFGLKLSNTLPVDVTAGELPSEEMYMAGRALFPLTTEMAARFARDLGGRVRISYAGGADAGNIGALFSLGIWPVTMATALLGPGGYQRLEQIGGIVDALPYRPFTGVDVEGIAALAASARRDPRYQKAAKPRPRRKLDREVPLLGCRTAPCRDGCPIRQDIPAYLELCRQERYADALRLILERDPIPSITGTICSRHCQDRCARVRYDRSVQIRETKLIAAERGSRELLPQLRPRPAGTVRAKAAVIGGGPTGMAAAYFLARAGASVSLFERSEALGGVVRQVIPRFRIPDEAIDQDTAFLERMGAEIHLGTEAPSVAELKAQGHDYILFAVGAWKAGRLEIPGNVVPALGWLQDLKAGRPVPLGHVVVVGGGDTAMDSARAALRAGAASSTILYRRDRASMPAEEEELDLALAEGVRFLELAVPVEQRDGELVFERARLGAPDTSGRRRPERTGERVSIPCDTVVAAVGGQVDSEIFTREGIEVDGRGRPAFQTNVPGVYVGGDARRGPATVVEGIADARAFADAVLGGTETVPLPAGAVPSLTDAAAKKGIVCASAKCEGDRCLHCDVVCEACVDVCPNRANVPIVLPDGRREILHVDRMCNECGNCTASCPYDSAPYRDKITLFPDRESFDGSDGAAGFLPLGGRKVLLRLDGRVCETDLDREDEGVPSDIRSFLLTVLDRYAYLTR